MDRAGGVQSHVRALSAWLNAQGHRATIVSPAEPHSNSLSGRVRIGHSKLVNMHGTQFELTAAMPWEMRRFKQFLDHVNPSIIHFHTPWVPLLPKQIFRSLTCPTVATFHATLPNTGQDVLSRWLLGQARSWTARLDGIAVPSLVPQAQWVAAGIHPTPRILAPAINLQLWKDAGQLRRPIAGSIQTIICVGRSEGRKGIGTIEAAWGPIKSALPHVTLRLVGGAANAQLQSGQVVRISQADDASLRSEVANADLLIAPADYGESFGLVLAEAMAAGTPILAAGNPAYMATLGQHGQFFEPNDPEDLARKVIALAGDPQARTRLQAFGRARAKVADIAVVGPEYLNFYEEAVVCSKHEG